MPTTRGSILDRDPVVLARVYRLLQTGRTTYKKNAQGQAPSGICTGLEPHEADLYYTAKRGIIGGSPKHLSWGLPQHETNKKLPRTAMFCIMKLRLKRT
jgi:hypothetical protein